MRLTTSAAMREMDRITIEDVGIAGIVLMESAGRSVADVVKGIYQDIGDGLVVVICGKGNNGGDGFVVARYLHSWGIEVSCLLAASREEVSGDALTQLDVIDTLGVSVVECVDLDNEHVQIALDNAVLFVDALLGTGLKSDVRELGSFFIEQMNSSGVPLVSVDLPSGICADTGRVLGQAVIADTTVTFGLAKLGLLVHPGCEHAGEIEIIDIGIPDEVVEHVGTSGLAVVDLPTPLLEPRSPDSHKGHFGHVLVVGGTPGRAGAALLAGMGAMRCGAGLVTLCCDERSHASLEGRYPELMVDTAFGADHFDESALNALVESRDVIVMGPGLAQTHNCSALVHTVLTASKTPMVVDATALTMLAAEPALFAAVDVPLILTPHPGEAATLLGCTSADIQYDRFAALERLVEKTNAVVVLKGARTLVGAPACSPAVIVTGNPGLASAGTGDVLAGVIGAFLARGLEPIDAATLGAYVHGTAGDLLAAEVGVEGMAATDLLDALPLVLKEPMDGK